MIAVYLEQLEENQFLRIAGNSIKKVKKLICFFRNRFDGRGALVGIFNGPYKNHLLGVSNF